MTRFYGIYVLMLSLMTLSCSEYNKVLKSTDIEYKYTKAVEYYEKQQYAKSLPIFEELIGLTRGTQRAEDVYYYYAKTHYGVKYYYLANYYFKSFTKTFSNSPRAEECQFLAAECSYQLSPSYSLDQTDTKNAVNEYQLFLDKYPNSYLKDSANNQVMRLNGKLEIKEFEIARMYVKTEKYKAATSALQDFMKAYPDSRFREEAMFLVVKSWYLYAEGSVEEKKLERMRSCVESYTKFATAFPESRILKNAADYKEKAEKQIVRLTSETESSKK